ncbi:oxoglutarate dehydrogenase [Heterostelium album PN500]|uniref:Oxoglutarate dehydrogenase n=1 Tax=Heterostelium pallidum (strain ATCC 26659 / Pp 5 / PN500) TaxID=670386 RepID=D3BJ15_HETP5|nr:oxoglutarate dehydrogenase [Heterostelium album PN500]EFA78789.1 oxoglutarate dehydrogenase [Heterostelium album PN500]|eukprot:XP_020430913.1 oxoglutarate dehydrogenase [Heterostelium album PN500]
MLSLSRFYSSVAHRSDVVRLVNGFRLHGHLKATVDPLARLERKASPLLTLEHYGLKESDVFKPTANVLKQLSSEKPLSGVIEYLNGVYCGDSTVQFEHIESEEEKQWLYDTYERIQNTKHTDEQKINILKQLVKSEVFDHFMQKKFPTTKRYGLEGNESMMVACDAVFSECAKEGVENVVIGMPHRGRLNLLVQMCNYPAKDLFWKVKGNSELPPGVIGIGDVLSHIGVSSDVKVDGGKVHVSLMQNPSHLEAVDPVCLGKTRAKQFYTNDQSRDRSVCLMLHGDAAFAGQGVVTETLSLSQLPGFTAGGAVHIVVNNQLGFTTIPLNGRSTRYSSDIGKFVGCPIILVNSQNPEAVDRVCRLAVEYRNQFKKDIIIDLIGWRKYGHNEVDEPSFTQPTMYTNIRKRTSIPQLYAKMLAASNIYSAEQLAEFTAAEQKALEDQLALTNVVDFNYSPADHLEGQWKGFVQSTRLATTQPETGVDKQTLLKIAEDSTKVPEDFTVHQRLVRSFSNARQEKTKQGLADWATAEAMAVGSLMKQGYNVRISGQDVGRGTFSQRHWELYEQSTDRVYQPLNNAGLPGKLTVVNSNLSEFAVLCYEYGYSLESPKTLPIWEAQFGDFFNGAQIAIDQFVANSESKWLRQSGLTLLLPHGFDGAGPEHSSCKIERFLQQCDTEAVDVKNPEKVNKETNMYVINPSTPANYFHALRRQMIRNYRKPLIVVGPKVLLRHPACFSSFDEMTPGTSFQTVLPDPDTVANPSAIERVIFCSGKIFYDLQEERKKLGDTTTAIVRLEELSPFPYEGVERELQRYSNAKDFAWCQEEQQNAGAWSFVEPRFKQRFSETAQIRYIGREPLCASAIGVSSIHKQEVAKLMKDAFAKQ